MIFHQNKILNIPLHQLVGGIFYSYICLKILLNMDDILEGDGKVFNLFNHCFYYCCRYMENIITPEVKAREKRKLQIFLKEIKEQRYVQALFRYGIVPLTLLLDEYEQDGNYEECQIIVDVINFVNKYTGEEDAEKLPTKYDSEHLAKLRSALNLFGFKGDIAIANTPYYIEEIKKLVEHGIVKKYNDKIKYKNGIK